MGASFIAKPPAQVRVHLLPLYRWRLSGSVAAQWVSACLTEFLQPFSSLLAPDLLLVGQELCLGRPLSRLQESCSSSDLVDWVVHLVAGIQLLGFAVVGVTLQQLEEDRAPGGVEVDGLVGVVDLDGGLLDVAAHVVV